MLAVGGTASTCNYTMHSSEGDSSFRGTQSLWGKREPGQKSFFITLHILSDSSLELAKSCCRELVTRAKLSGKQRLNTEAVIETLILILMTLQCPLIMFWVHPWWVDKKGKYKCDNEETFIPDFHTISYSFPHRLGVFRPSKGSAEKIHPSMGKTIYLISHIPPPIRCGSQSSARSLWSQEEFWGRGEQEREKHQLRPFSQEEGFGGSKEDPTG